MPRKNQNLIPVYLRVDRYVLCELRKVALADCRNISSQIRVVLKAWADGRAPVKDEELENSQLLAKVPPLTEARLAERVKP